MSVDVYSSSSGKTTRKVYYDGNTNINFYKTCRNIALAKQRTKELNLLLVKAGESITVALPVRGNQRAYLPLTFSFRAKDKERTWNRLGDISNEETAMKIAAQYAIERDILHVS